jgi:hypothetical protein
MAERTCAVPGCERSIRARGWCERHYSRWRTTGDLRADVPIGGHPLLDRLIARTEKTDSCWLWTGALDLYGYGQFIRGKSAHRAAYELQVGPIPAGHQIDHLCRVRNCVNPAHLEAVTARENTLRSRNRAAMNARKTHCKRGHEFNDDNTYITPTGARQCRACRRKDSP